MSRRATIPALGIALDISGDEEIAQAFATVGTAVWRRVRNALADLSEEILAREKAGMAVRTGETRASFDYEIKDKPQGITARIGWWRTGGPGGAGWKGIFQESGVKGPVTVRRFERGARGGYVRKTISLKSGARRRIKVVLGTYERDVHIAAKPFVAPVWRAIQPRVQATIDAAIDLARKDGGFGG